MFGSKFAVIGFTGSGKTTFSRALSEVVDSPHIELDRIYWKANWERPSHDEFVHNLSKSITGVEPSFGWIADGSHEESREYIWTRCDVIIWLDYSKKIILSRYIKRFLSNYFTSRTLWGLNKESFYRSFLNKNTSIVKKLLEDYADTRALIFEDLKQYTFRKRKNGKDEVKIIRFTSPERAEEWLNYHRLTHQLTRLNAIK